MRISDWSSVVCSSDLIHDLVGAQNAVADRNRSLGQRVEEHQRRRLVAADPHARALACVDDISRKLAARTAVHRDGHHGNVVAIGDRAEDRRKDRSEEHTSELQSLMRNSYAVLCLKKQKTK